MSITATLRFQSGWKSKQAITSRKCGVGGTRSTQPLTKISSLALTGSMALVLAGHVYAAPPEHLVGKSSSSRLIDKQQLTGRLDTGGSEFKRTLWWRTGLDRGIDPYLLYAVALTESARAFNDIVAPWPWALNRNGETIYPDGHKDAAAHIRSLLASGHQSIDIGLMQVDLRWHGHRVQRAEDLLDPVTNLHVGADILAESIASAPGDLILGVGRYHSWNDRSAAYQYGRKVLALADLIKSTWAW